MQTWGRAGWEECRAGAAMGVHSRVGIRAPGVSLSAHVLIGYMVPGSARKARRARPVGVRNKYCVVFFLISGLCPSLKSFPWPSEMLCPSDTD